MLIEWCILASNEWNGNIEYTYLNMTLLLTFAVLSIMLVRFVIFIFGSWIHGVLRGFMYFMFPELFLFEGVKESHTKNMEQISEPTQNIKVNIEISDMQSSVQMFQATVESMPQVFKKPKKTKQKK